MRQGNAKLTATTQHFLDTCPAVKSWTPSADETTATFLYDETVEVGIVPDGVEFSDDAIESESEEDIEERLIRSLAKINSAAADWYYEFGANDLPDAGVTDEMIEAEAARLVEYFNDVVEDED